VPALIHVCSDPLHRARPDTELKRNLAHPRITLLESLTDLALGGDIEPWAAEFLARRLRSRQARADPLLNHRPFELSENAQHSEHGFAARRCRVEALLMEEQVDLKRVQFGQEADEVFERTTQPIDTPRHDDIELAARRIPAKGIERGPLVAALRAADAVVLVELDHLIARALGNCAELALLVGGRLILSAHPKVKDGTTHRALLGSKSSHPTSPVY
jgi:hypothetical protein